MGKKKKLYKERVKLSAKEAIVNSPDKLNRSMPNVYRGCGVIGDTKYNRKKSKGAVQKEIKNFMDSSFDLILYNSVLFAIKVVHLKT
ncbi:hypothetical protein F8154_08710 [Alkaliphilus pronyensis]|uniref:Uncharacterized protein n=1 Tax=Alkaliphilus pronyensis TaxID=1482732 RepID=A0A6I0FFA5_9FIRM|nr:hypothetical protein [Alkaliphilus pronyensis]KAB3534483.1 hypothetical protein F8154_08710 [Alkaliphilus pronyensis]